MYRIRQVFGVNMLLCSKMVFTKMAHTKLFQTVYFLWAVVEILLLSGITYGWASIVIVFKAEGFFQNLCPVIHNNTTNSSLGSNGKGSCPVQSKRFNLVFNVAVAFLCSAKLPIGIFVDRFGPRAGQIFGCVLYVIGGLGLAFVTKETANILFIIFILFSIGGGFIAVAKYQVSRIIYTKFRSLILSVLHGTFDSSAIVLVFFKLAWESGVNLRNMSLFYTALAFVLVVVSTIFLTAPYSDLLDEAFRNEPSSKRRTESKEISGSIKEEDTIPVSLIPETLWSSIFSSQYLLELSYLCIIQLRLWFFIGSLDELIDMVFQGDRSSVNNYITYFGYAQFCGIAVGPIIGYIFDRNVIKCSGNAEENPLVHVTRAQNFLQRLQQSVLPFFITNFLCVAFSVFAMTSWKPGLIISFVLHVVTRGFLYSSHASFIGIAFRPEKFGTLYGLGIFAAGIFGLLEYPLYTVVHVFLSTDPFWMNGILLILAMLTNAFPFYLMYRCKKISRILYPEAVMHYSK